MTDEVLESECFGGTYSAKVTETGMLHYAYRYVIIMLRITYWLLLFLQNQVRKPVHFRKLAIVIGTPTFSFMNEWTNRLVAPVVF